MPKLAALTALLVLALASPAGAQIFEDEDPVEQCTHAASDYESAGAPGGGAVNDPRFGEQWGLNQIKAPIAWSRGALGSNVTIAILDTGADFSHPDLQTKLLPGTDFVDDDANNCAGAQDENGHGTHVSGIAAAVTNNGVGVAGTAPEAQILPVRVLDDNGDGNSDWIINGIRYAADNGARVINLSLGEDPVIGQLPVGPNRQIEEAVEYAYSKNAVVVGAAGNESFPACSYPSAARRAICVAATDSREDPAFYSNFPADPDGTVAVRAPGGSGSAECEDGQEDIWSTIWPSAVDPEDCRSGSQIRGYETLAGTSMATPFVSGLAAMLAGQGLSAGQILECIRTKSSNRGRYDPVYGWGIVDADAATRECSPQSTSEFSPPASSGGGGGQQGGTQGGQNAQNQGLVVRVRIHRTTRRKLRRRGRVRVTVSVNRATTVRVLAHMTRRHNRSRRGGRVVGRRRLNFTGAGSRRAWIRFDKPARRALRRRSGYRVNVRWEAEGLQGAATSARR